MGSLPDLSRLVVQDIGVPADGMRDENALSPAFLEAATNGYTQGKRQRDDDDPPKIYHMPSGKKWQSMHPNVGIAFIGLDKGLGVFATKMIKKYEFVGFFTGVWALHSDLDKAFQPSNKNIDSYSALFAGNVLPYTSTSPDNVYQCVTADELVVMPRLFKDATRSSIWMGGEIVDTAGLINTNMNGENVNCEAYSCLVPTRDMEMPELRAAVVLQAKEEIPAGAELIWNYKWTDDSSAQVYQTKDYTGATHAIQKKDYCDLVKRGTAAATAWSVLYDTKQIPLEVLGPPIYAVRCGAPHEQSLNSPSACATKPCTSISLVAAQAHGKTWVPMLKTCAIVESSSAAAADYLTAAPQFTTATAEAREARLQGMATFVKTFHDRIKDGLATKYARANALERYQTGMEQRAEEIAQALRRENPSADTEYVYDAALERIDYMKEQVARAAILDALGIEDAQALYASSLLAIQRDDEQIARDTKAAATGFRNAISNEHVHAAIVYANYYQHAIEAQAYLYFKQSMNVQPNFWTECLSPPVNDDPLSNVYAYNNDADDNDADALTRKIFFRHNSML